jgi:hypothetical protein
VIITSFGCCTVALKLYGRLCIGSNASIIGESVTGNRLQITDMIHEYHGPASWPYGNIVAHDSGDKNTVGSRHMSPFNAHNVTGKCPVISVIMLRIPSVTVSDNSP